MNRRRFLARTTGTLSTAPADARATASERGAVPRSGTTTPAPSPSATRRTAPRFWGSWISSRIRRNLCPLPSRQGRLLLEIPPDGDPGHRPLVPGAGRPVQGLPGPVSDRDAVCPAESLEGVDPPVVPLRVEEHPLDFPRAGAHGLLDRVEARENHDPSVSRAMAIAARPSSRPVKPRPFALVPRTLTASGFVPEDLGDARANRGHVWRELRSFGHDDRVDVTDGEAAPARELARLAQERRAVGALPGRIGRREVVADRARARRAEHRVRQSVQKGVSVGVTLQAGVVRDLDAAQAQGPALRERVRVEAHTDANRHRDLRETQDRLRELQVGGVVILNERRDTRTTATGIPRASHNAASSVASFPDPSALAGCPPGRPAAWRRPEPGAIDGPDDAALGTSLTCRRPERRRSPPPTPRRPPRRQRFPRP